MDLCKLIDWVSLTLMVYMGGATIGARGDISPHLAKVGTEGVKIYRRHIIRM